ncbi:hypothetical protein [Syntrophomonas erecta]
MQQSTLISLNKLLSKLENNLVRIQTFQEKGCAVGSLLNETHLDLRDVGNYLDTAPTDQALAETTEKYKALLVKFQSIADEVEVQDDGLVMSSHSTLPEFFYRITGRYQDIWKMFEKTSAAFGVGMVGFTLIGLTYFLAVGNIPFIGFYDGVISGINGVVFVIGVILGLCVHEFAHGVVLANNGIKINRVGAMAGSMVGGFVEADETTFFAAHPRVRLRFNAASIGTNALLAVILAAIGIITSSQLLIVLALGNLFFGFINSFPISPLDGGWVYEDLVKLHLTNENIKRIFLSARFALFLIWIILFVRLAL